MKWHIITDSSSDLNDFQIEENYIKHTTVPFVFNIGDATIIDNPNLDTLSLLEKIASGNVGTACPSPYDWYKEMEEEANYILITISSSLSGSFNSATLAKDMVLSKYPNRNIHIIDSKSTGPEIILLVEKICELIKQDKTFNDVIELSNQFLQESKIIFALSSFDNLVRAGRISKIVGKLAKILGIWGVGGASSEGTIKLFKKVKGEKQVMKSIVENIESNVIYPHSVVISHCHNLSFAEKLKTKIKELWCKAKVKITQTKGLCSYYAEKNGIIVGYWGKHIFDEKGNLLKCANENISNYL